MAKEIEGVTLRRASTFGLVAIIGRLELRGSSVGATAGYRADVESNRL